MALILRPDYMDGFMACFEGKLLTQNSPYEKIYKYWLEGNRYQKREVDRDYPEFIICWNKAAQKREDRQHLKEYKQDHPDRKLIKGDNKEIPTTGHSNSLQGAQGESKKSVGHMIQVIQKRLDQAGFNAW